MSFFDIHKQADWDDIKASIYSKTESDVKLALESKRCTLEDFKALISPAATPFLEQMAGMSREITLKRFGKTIQLYLPLYLSNACTNSCVYCGFNHENKAERVTLTHDQIEREMEAIKLMGYKHILLVTGEHPLLCGYKYLSGVIELVKQHFSLISLEVAPMNTDEYALLAEKGVHSVYIYQETYNAANYKSYHPKGKKSDFRYRLETPDRLGEAGIHKIGLGCLLGLEDWRTDSFFTAMHLKYLEKEYWKTKYSISFPRLRPHTGNFEPNSVISDRDLLQLICAYRIFNNDIEISLSTRENQTFRDNMLQLGVTAMSAGSKTEPGGYTFNDDKNLEQFAICDDRSPQQIADMIKSKGYEPVWKDWDNFSEN